MDVAAAQAQAQRAAATDLAQLLERSIGLWQKASELCTGRAQTRALRSLVDSQRLREELGDVRGQGAKCSAAQRDAQSIEELAKQAVADRRWRDAALLFRRAENSWDLAAESCTGPLQDAAVRRRLQVETDGHNAEYCGPPFDEAMEFARRMRSNLPSLAPAARQSQQQMAETLWRDAAEVCKDRPLEVATLAAQTLARERGTPWVATRPPGHSSPARPGGAERPTATATRPAAAVAGALQGAAGTVAQAATTAAQAARNTVTGAVAAVTGTAAAAAGATAQAVLGASTGPSRGPAAPPAPSSPASATPAPAAPAPPAAPPTPPPPTRVEVVLDGGTRLAGIFSQDPVSRLYSGQGRVEWPNGDTYEGQVRAGMRHGLGEIVWATGQRYRGEWVDDRANGRGTMRFPNGNEWEGDVQDGQPHGTGRMRYPSGDVYSGQVQRGVPEGVGVYVSANGDRHEGAWSQGRAQGKGIKTFARGGRIEAEFQDGQAQGQVRMLTDGGDEYTGPMTQGVPDGPTGVYRWANGQRYEGPWVKGEATGSGRLAFANGNIFVGDIVAGLPQGTGTLTYLSGDVYVGKLNQGVPDGEGRYAWKNGDVYEGGWRQGRKHGAGVMRWANGDRWEGVYADDAQTAQGRLIRRPPGSDAPPATPPAAATPPAPR